MKKSTLLFAAAALGFGSLAHADVAGVHGGAAYWMQSPSGTFEEESLGEFDVEDDLGLDDKNNGFVWLALEHPVPLLPNVKLQYTTLNIDGEGTVEQEFTIGGTTYTVGEDVDSDVSLNHFDITLYYELLDDGLNLDVGINVKAINGEIKVVGDTLGEEKLDFSAPLPMLYAHAELDFPIDGLSAGAEGSYTSYSGSSLADFRGYVAYEFAVGIGVEVGVRSFSFKLDDIGDINGDFKVSGAYGALTFDF